MGIMDTLLEQIYKDNKRRCPSCNEQFYPGDCDVVATIPAGKILRRAPLPHSWSQHIARWDPKPLTGEDFTLKQAQRVCPNPQCRYLLPHNIELADSLNIAIVGDVSSGKSHYIAALIKQIEQGKLLRPNQHITFRCLTPDREKYYTDEYFRPLFELQQRLPPSQREVNVTHEPLIYELSIKPDAQRPARNVNLILYDTSGEDYVVQSRLVQFSRYVLSANALIFLADPMTMPEISTHLPPHLDYGAAPGQSSTAALNSIIALLERYHNKSAGSRLSSLPIAITLSKSDLLKYLTPISQQYNFMRLHHYKGGIDLQDLAIVDREVKKVLTDFGDPTLLQASHSFKRLKFFAASATGHPPDQNGQYPAVEPQRCLDPVMWILYELKIITPETAI